MKPFSSGPFHVHTELLQMNQKYVNLPGCMDENVWLTGSFTVIFCAFSCTLKDKIIIKYMYTKTFTYKK